MRIVIFDDDEDVLFVCAYYFRAKGWDVETFNNCNNIENKLSVITPDLIMMDNWIPDQGGVAATQKIKKHARLKNIPVIFFSANSDIELLAKAAGADRYIQKPFQFDELDGLISAAIISSNNLLQGNGQSN